MSEAERLRALYGTLRERLLDLTLRNRMLNYPVTARSRSQLQIVDEVLEEVHLRLVHDDKALRLQPLPEPGGQPEDEKGEDFVAAFEHARISDVVYQTAIEALVNTGRDDEASVERLDRQLRDRVREQLGLPPRPARAEVNRAEHARSLGIEPALDLVATAAKPGHQDGNLQTLKFPDELAAIMAKIHSEARLAEQEAGLSTLFLAFGFLEWYESEASDKPRYAPLLLLPVRTLPAKLRGKAVYDILAREDDAEVNVSLARYLLQKEGRALPDFAPGEDPAGAVEAYLAGVRAAIEGLPRWQVRRWLVLGHFAFSRIAIYEDTDPARWAAHPAEHGLVEALLSGYEREAAGAVPTFRAPEDYAIDDPAVEALAPFLIQDADASQHSALIDVMKGRNLVIQGPPGTGKSQTITNVIANALAAGKTVLFLAEKQAALDVVKRRLDASGLGTFCLELHSDKVAARAVVKSLADRHEMRSDGACPLAEDTTLAATRGEMADYLAALHQAAADGVTPFQLIWKAIRGRSRNGDMEAVLRAAIIPPALLAEPGRLADLAGHVGIYADIAQRFTDRHGHPSLSPWSMTPPGDLPAYEREPMQAALRELRDATAALYALEGEESPGAATRMEAEALAAAEAGLPVPPDGAPIAAVAAEDMEALETALRLQQEALGAAADLAGLPAIALEGEALEAAARMAQMMVGSPWLRLTPAQVQQRGRTIITHNHAFIAMAHDLEPAMAALGFGLDTPADWLEAIATAIVAAGSVGPLHRPFLALPGIDGVGFERLLARWRILTREETELRAVAAGLGAAPWPPLAELEEAIRQAGRGGLGRLFGNRGGSDLLRRLGVPPGEAPAFLARLAAHRRAVAAFESDADAARLAGSAWAGMATPFEAMNGAVALRWSLRQRLAPLPGGEAVLAALLAQVEGGAGLAMHEAAAAAWLDGLADIRHLVEPVPLTQALVHRREDIAFLHALLDADADGRLAAETTPVGVLGALHEARQRLAAAETARDAMPLAGAVAALAADAPRLAATRAAVAWVRRVREAGLPPALQAGLLSEAAAAWRQRFGDWAARHRAAAERRETAQAAVAAYGLSGLELLQGEPLLLHLDALQDHAAGLPDFISLRARRATLERAGLGDFLRRSDEALCAPKRLPELFEAAIARARAEAARRAADPLARANGDALEARRASFAERDRRKLLADRAAIRDRLLAAAPLPGLRQGPVGTWTEMSLLAHEFPKQRRHTAVRPLLARAGNAIRALKPCFMMSPLSLAKFMPPGGFDFDLLVIDEASQMRPEDALGAMLRAKQVVVVGDSRQLPPTSFFDRADRAADEDDQDGIDDESILERCEKVFGERRTLRWHYRSRCESLIRFSNDIFYDGKLITFPAARPGSFSIHLVRVEGAYSARRNSVEAEQVAEAAVEFMRQYGDAEPEALPTMGVVAINIEQRDLIDDVLRRFAADDERVDAYMRKAEAKGEPVFVKNLENVQGDERDFIFISLTYGREPGAVAMAQRFGPINSRQGHRRLNVLFTRARIRIILFASFGSADIRAGEGSHDGVRVLKRYLDYAETGGRAPVESVGGEAESDFEAEVAERLGRRGYDCDMQVGVSGYRIDLGVRHPDNPGTFLAGIECDGARYHSSRSARDRDRLRGDVLAGLGWRLLRVWSTDWFDDPETQTDRLVKALGALRQQPVAVPPDYVVGAAFQPDMTAASVAEASAGEEPAAADTIPGTPLLPSEIRVEAPAGMDEETPLSPEEAATLLTAFRDNVIRVRTGEWRPQRSILRDGMIETLIRQNITDADDWFRRVPIYLRTATDPAERRLYFDRICAVIARIRPQGADA